METKRWFLSNFCVYVMFFIVTIPLGIPVIASGDVNLQSDGSDGLFHPLQNAVIDLTEKNVFNFTSIVIPDGVRVSFSNADPNLPVYFLAANNVLIEGTLDLRGPGSSVAGPGGYDGGPGGTGGAKGTAGQGVGGGYGGVYRHPGGGASFATGGSQTKIDGCLTQILPPPPKIAYVPDLFEGGSGGGGGGGGAYNVAGCPGGGGGGAVILTTPYDLVVTGNILTTGTVGANCYTSALCGIRGGPGGGGSGGMIRLAADTVIIESDGNLNCSGGKGGVRSSDGTLTSFGGNGGYGYIVIKGSDIDLNGDLLGVLVLNDCMIDLDTDGDLDGKDVSIMLSAFDNVCLKEFAKNFGRTYFSI